MFLEQTLTIIKPDSFLKKNVGAILHKCEQSDFKILAMKMLHLNKKQAHGFYIKHSNKLFFNNLIKFIISGPILVVVLESINAIQKYRNLIGSKNPLEALHKTIRFKYGENIMKNAVHGSDSIQSAEREITFFFGEGEIY